ncbi:Jouberin [Bulinus truncatus]|nr:Jouberin [Bulinus truncatus]
MGVLIIIFPKLFVNNMAENELKITKPRKRRAEAHTDRTRQEALITDMPSSNTQIRVDELLQQVVAQSAKDASDAKKKKKKKLRKDADENLLENLRKGKDIESLHKDEDTTLLANIYDPDEKGEKSNKQRQRQREANKSTNSDKSQPNISHEKSTNPEPKKTNKVKKKDENHQPVAAETQNILPEKKERKTRKSPSALTAEASIKTEDFKDEPVSVTSTPRKKKKKKPNPESEEEAVKVEHKEEKDAENEPSAAVKEKVRKKKTVTQSEELGDAATTESAPDATSPVKPKPRKKKKPKEVQDDGENDKENETAEDIPQETTEMKPEKKKKKKKVPADDTMLKEEENKAEAEPAIPDEGEVLAVMIHRTDKLKNDFHILHPVVRVHVLNEETGEYIPKQHQDRAVTYYSETSNQAVKTILPMMTQPFDFKERKSTIPIWEDLLVFNENFNYFTQPNPKVILLFELLDFVSMNTASRQFVTLKAEGGWHRIAWAFLKVLGKNNKVNIGNKLRLQLFVPPNKISKNQGQPEVYQWWKSGQRLPYPSTLYVTLKSIESPPEVSPAMRSMFATQKELGNMKYEDLKSKHWSSFEKTTAAGRTLSTWTRLLGQLCRVPNSLSLTLPAGKKGCFVLKFSNDGRNLACACQAGSDFPILIYEVPKGTLKGQFQGHFAIIYSLCWNKTDTLLMSASSDGTVRIWDMQKLGESQIRLLPHPGYVYTAEFHPRVDSIVVTGGYDEVVRVWDISVPEDYNILQQEMEEHHGHINSICFDVDDGQKMYSADSVGTILIWNVYVTEQVSRKHFVRDWTKYQEIKEPDLKDTPINFIKMHPSGRRLLVHGRNNAIYMFDLRVQRVMQKYFGADNLKEKICSTITPCGSFVFSGSEDGKVYAWNTDTGDQVAVYTQLNYNMPVTDVHYHPRDHMLAICSLGDNQPIYVYKYDPQISLVDGARQRPMSPLETTDILELETPRTSTLKDMDLQSARSKVMSKEEFETFEKLRYLRVMKKLDTATMQMTQMPGMVAPDGLLSPRFDTIGRTGVQSTWKLDTSYLTTPRSATTPPGVLSPHAPSGSGTHLAAQLTSHRDYMRESGGSWRPGFSEISRHGTRSSSPTVYGRPPHLSLSTSLGKPQFTFEAPVKTSRVHKVVAIYDYRAQRSDELSLYKGDVIKVLYKDNEKWWMGELPDGQQGFFPANYVSEDENDLDETKKGHSSGGTVTAVKTKSGELKFLSGGEDSDTETPRKQKKKTSFDLTPRRDSRSSLPPPAPAKILNDSIEALLNEYESAA